MRTTQSKDGTTLAYDVHGGGPALIFITGATCFRSFEPVLHDAQIFAQQFSVYNYDRRGHGDSGNTLPYAMERELEDIEAMIDAAGGTAYVYGHSSGAILALEAAMHLEGKVSKVVLYDPAYAHDEADQLEFKALIRALNALRLRVRIICQIPKCCCRYYQVFYIVNVCRNSIIGCFFCIDVFLFHDRCR